MKEDREKFEFYKLESAMFLLGLMPSEIIEKGGAGTIQLYLRVPGKYQVWGIELCENQVTKSALFPIEFFPLNAADCKSVIALEDFRKTRFESGFYIDENGNLQEAFFPIDFRMKHLGNIKNLTRRVAFASWDEYKIHYEFVVCPVGLKKFSQGMIVDMPVLISDIYISNLDLEMLDTKRGRKKSAHKKTDGIKVHKNWSGMLRLLKKATEYFWLTCHAIDKKKYFEENIKSYLLCQYKQSTPKSMERSGYKPIKKYFLPLAIKICTPDVLPALNHPGVELNETNIYSKLFKDLVKVSEENWKDVDLKDGDKIPPEDKIIDDFLDLGYNPTNAKHAAMIIRPKTLRSTFEYNPKPRSADAKQT